MANGYRDYDRIPPLLLDPPDDDREPPRRAPAPPRGDAIPVLTSVAEEARVQFHQRPQRATPIEAELDAGLLAQLQTQVSAAAGALVQDALQAECAVLQQQLTARVLDRVNRDLPDLIRRVIREQLQLRFGQRKMG